MSSASARSRSIAGSLALAAGVGYRLWRRRRTFRFAGRVVAITGGSRGLGLALARVLAAEGARLALVARDRPTLARAVADLRATWPHLDVAGIAADVRGRDDAGRAIREVVDRFGQLDVLVNNARIIQVGPFDHMRVEDYEDAMRTHFGGPLFTVLAAVPHMRQRGSGRVVNISSIGGRVAVPHLLPYCASKFALAGLSDGLRGALAGDGIVVTTVYPGLMRTGSPVNATFKGRTRAEYAWFAIADSLPGLSVSAPRAARQIVEACRGGRAELVLTVPAAAAVRLRALAPAAVAEAMTLVEQLLPGPAASNTGARYGHECESAWAAPSAVLTAPTYRAARRLNQRPSLSGA